MYRPLPDGLTIKNSPIEGLGLFATQNIKANSFIGVTHIRDEQFENKYIRTPLGEFYNHSDDPTVVRMVTDSLPKLKFGDVLDVDATTKKFPGNDNDGENVFFLKTSFFTTKKAPAARSRSGCKTLEKSGQNTKSVLMNFFFH